MRTPFIILLAWFITVEVHALPLFQLEYEGKISYILGTHHAMPLSVLPAGFSQLIRNSRLVLIESEYNAEQDQREIGEFRQRGYAEAFDNRSLFGFLDWLKVKALVESSGVYSLQVFGHLKPPAAYQVLSQLFHREEKSQLVRRIADYVDYLRQSPQLETKMIDHLLQMEQWASEPIMDESIGKLARENSLLVVSLDGDSYLAMCSKVVNSVVLRRYVHAKLKLLSKPIVPYRLRPDEFWATLAMKDRYLKWGPADDLYPPSAPIIDPIEEYANGRHKVWMTHIASELHQGGVFVAVGLLHLIGDENNEGLITMLSQSGIKVTLVQDCQELLSAKSIKNK